MPEAGHDLATSLYAELHRRTVGKRRFERGNHTFQPNALVNEALRLANRSDSMWQDRTRVLGVAANVMCRILVDYARARNAGKRGNPKLKVTLDKGLIATGTCSNRPTLLADFDRRQARCTFLQV